MAAIKAAGQDAVAVQADTSKIESAQRLVDAAVSAFGKLDIWVNNAAILRVAPLWTCRRNCGIK